MKKDKKKTANEKSARTEDARTKDKAENDFSSAENESELRQPVWSVVDFERRAAKNLTYAEAERKIAALEKQGVSGLCLVTDATAERIAGRIQSRRKAKKTPKI